MAEEREDFSCHEGEVLCERERETSLLCEVVRKRETLREKEKVKEKKKEREGEVQ